MLIFDEKELYYAIFFEKIELKTLGFPVLIPKRSMIRTIDEDRTIFTELSSGIKHLNFYDIFDTEISEGFELCISVEDILKTFEKKELSVTLRELWEIYEENVYFYREIDGNIYLSSKSKEDFYLEIGIDFRSISVTDLNNLKEDYVNGIITTENYCKNAYKRKPLIRLLPKEL